MKMEWVWNIRRQCEEQGIPFFFKQVGGHPNKHECLIDGVEIKQWPVAA
jgi:protein gp37